MVWDVQSACDDREQALSAHLLRELESRYATSSEQRAVFRDVAHSVAVFCADDLRRGIPSTDLQVLLSRALWGVGATDTAEHVLTDHLEQHSIKQTLKALLSVSDVSPMLWRAVVRGAVRRRTEWLSADDMPLWVLDLERIQRAACDMELARFMTARILVRALAPVWDATTGHGALAVRGFDAPPHSLAIPTFCRDVLRHESRIRRWRVVPRVLRFR